MPVESSDNNATETNELGAMPCRICGKYSTGRLFTPNGPVACCGGNECSMNLAMEIAMNDTDDLRDIR